MSWIHQLNRVTELITPGNPSFNLFFGANFRHWSSNDFDPGYTGPCRECWSVFVLFEWKYTMDCFCWEPCIDIFLSLWLALSPQSNLVNPPETKSRNWLILEGLPFVFSNVALQNLSTIYIFFDFHWFPMFRSSMFFGNFQLPWMIWVYHTVSRGFTKSPSHQVRPCEKWRPNSYQICQNVPCPHLYVKIIHSYYSYPRVWLRAQPWFFRPHRFFLGIQRTLVQGNLNDVSKEFLGNHQIPTPVKRYFQVNGHGV